MWFSDPKTLPPHTTDARSVHRLLVTATVVPSSRILITLMMEAQSSSKTSVLTRATNIPEDGFLQYKFPYEIANDILQFGNDLNEMP
jgi:hypothetical protein